MSNDKSYRSLTCGHCPLCHLPYDVWPPVKGEMDILEERIRTFLALMRTMMREHGDEALANIIMKTSYEEGNNKRLDEDLESLMEPIPEDTDGTTDQAEVPTGGEERQHLQSSLFGDELTDESEPERTGRGDEG